MIVDERMVTYIRSLEVPESAVIEAIEQEALRPCADYPEGNAEFSEDSADDQKTDADFGSRSCGWFFVNSYE